MYLFLVSMLSLILFAVGLYGIMVSNVGIKMLISIEILINSAILELVTVAVSSGTVDPIILALFGIAIGAVESVIGLSLLTATFKRIGNVAIALLREIKW